MRFRLRVVAKAERQIRHAADWWHENRPAARDLLHSELSRAFELITTQPRIGRKSPELGRGEIRRVVLVRSQFFLYYRVLEESQVVQVVGLWHTSRGSSPPI